MPFVRPRACGDVDDCAGVATVLGAEGRVVGLELLHGVDRGLEGDLVLHHVVEVDAVDLEVDGVLAVAGGVEGERALAAQRCGQKAVLRRRDRAGDEQAEVNEVATVQGNLLHGALVDDRADRGGRRLDDGRVGGDGHGLRDVADCELEVLDDRARHLDVEVVGDLRLEPLGLYLDVVEARLQGGDLIVALAVGLRGALCARRAQAHRHLRVRHDRALLVGHAAL